MNEKRKRRSRIQFHLSTAIVLMFVAGGILWVNLTERYLRDTRIDPELKTILEMMGMKDANRGNLLKGWPLPFRIQRIIVYPYGKDIATPELSAEMRLIEPSKRDNIHFINGIGIGITENAADSGVMYAEAAFDFGIAMAVLFIIAFICEWWIRRKIMKIKIETPSSIL